MAHIKNIPLNIEKHIMRCAKKCFFIIWRRKLATCQRLTYASYRGSLGERFCPRSATAMRSVAVKRTDTFSDRVARGEHSTT